MKRSSKIQTITSRKKARIEDDTGGPSNRPEQNQSNLGMELNQENELRRENELGHENELSHKNEFGHGNALNPEMEINEENLIKKKKIRNAPIWNHFTAKISDGGNDEYGHCNYCTR